MIDKKYTIKDIARLAGVSTGTVDRVMHNRGEVSEASRVKVQKVLDEIDYQPNVFAIGLAAKKKYTVACLIPYYIENDYWYSVAKGIEKAADELSSFNVTVDFVYYNHSDSHSYQTAQKKIFMYSPDAVLIAPNFRDETLNFTSELSGLNIPFAFIDVNIESVDALTYIGQDSYQSGYIAAKLLVNQYKETKDLVLFLSNYKDNPSEFQMQRRLEGFMKYFSENSTELSVHEVILNRDDYEESKQVLNSFFETCSDSCLGVVFNSRVYQVGRYLLESGKKMDRLIGYDLLPENVSLLNEGVVTYLIGQRPGLQGYCAIKALSDKVVFKKEVAKVKYMPIDILIKENIDYYFEFI